MEDEDDAVSLPEQRCCKDNCLDNEFTHLQEELAQWGEFRSKCSDDRVSMLIHRVLILAHDGFYRAGENRSAEIVQIAT